MYSRFVKRFCDILAAAALLVLLLPLILLVGLAVRLFLGGPVFYADIRAGRFGRPIRLVKFRTMTDARGGTGALVSVILGDMSMVGPRPLPLRYVERYSPRQAVRLKVLPGLTGWAQIHGRNAVDWPVRLELDARYVDMLGRWYAPFLDIYIVVCTILQMTWQALTGRGIAAPGSATMHEFNP